MESESLRQRLKPGSIFRRDGTIEVVLFRIAGDFRNRGVGLQIAGSERAS